MSLFFGLGGYIGLYLTAVKGWSLIVAALVAGVAVTLLALVLGLAILRLRGAYFALATIGVLEAVQAFVSNFNPWGRSSRPVCRDGYLCAAGRADARRLDQPTCWSSA